LFSFQPLLSSLSSLIGAARLVLPPLISDRARRWSRSGGHSRDPPSSRAGHPHGRNGGKLRRIGMKADQIKSDNTFTTSASIFFCWMWNRADFTRMRLQMRVFSDVRYGAESDRCRSGCGLI
jgi:hypothetical protein